MLGELEAANSAVAFMTPEQVGNAWVLLKKVQKLAENIDEALRLRAQQGIIPLPNGKRLAMVEQNGRASFDRDKAESRIRELGGRTDDLMKKGKPFFKVAEVNMESAKKAG
jgi:hypothetical protein